MEYTVLGTCNTLRRHKICSRLHLSTTDHVNQNTVHARSSLLTCWCVNKERHEKYADMRGYTRTGIENRWFSGSVECVICFFTLRTHPNPSPRCHHPSQCFTVDIVRCQFGRHRPTLVCVNLKIFNHVHHWKIWYCPPVDDFFQIYHRHLGVLSQTGPPSFDQIDLR